MDDLEYTRLKSDKAWLRREGWWKKFNRTKTTYEEFRAPFHEYNPKVRVDQPLSIYQLAPAFMLFSFGIAVALISIGREFCSRGGIEKLTRDCMKLPKMVRKLIFWAVIEFTPSSKPTQG